MPTYLEPSRELPVADSYDVIVCGGGPAGVAAAIAAGRAGAKTLLLELHGCLGGIWTTGMLSWILDHHNKPGLMAEILEALDQRGARRVNAYDLEVMKLLLEELCTAAGVDVLLHARVVGAAVEEGQLKLVLTETKSGREAWKGKVFIDATGDGDLAARAGCGFDLGRPDNGECQPMSLMALLTGLHADDLATNGFLCGGHGGHGEAKQNLFAEMARAGVEPSYAGPTLFSIHDGLIAMMANHEYGVSAIDARQLSAATLRARAELHRLVNALRGLGGIWRDLALVATGAQIGVREGRRIRGRYTVSAEDLVNGARFDDAVCRCAFPVDVHSTNPGRDGKYLSNDGVKAQPYDLPLRSLIAADVVGLMMAGRCISGDFIAHSSYRVTGDAVAMGEVAGLVAAAAAANDVAPHEVPWRAEWSRVG